MKSRLLALAACSAVAIAWHPAIAQRFRVNAARMIAHQVAVECGVGALPGALFTDVRLDSMMTPAAGVVLWRGTAIDVSHESPFIVASLAPSVIPLRLGGFPSPQVE